MNDEAKAFLREQIKAKTPYQDIRREMISHGFGTAELETTYKALAEEMGVKLEEPATAKPKETILSFSSSQVGENDEGVVKELPGPGPFLKFSFRMTISKMSAILFATAIMALAYSIMALVPSEPTHYIYGTAYFVVMVLATLASGFLSVIGSMSLIYTIARSDMNASFTQGIQWAFSRFAAIIWLSFVSAFISIISFAVLIVPGIAFAIYSIFSFIVLAKDDQRGTMAITRSVDLVRGSFWQITGRILLLALIIVVLSLFITLPVALVSAAFVLLPGGFVVASALNAFLQMLMLALVTSAVVCLYNNRAKAKPFFDANQYSVLRWVFRVLAMIGLLIPLIAFVAGAFTVQSIVNELNIDNNFRPAPKDQVDEQGLFNDFLVTTHVNTTYTSGLAYRNSMYSFEGVCSDIIVEDPVRCLNTDETFVVYAPDGQGAYYCRDNSNFKGTINRPPTNAFSCQ